MSDLDLFRNIPIDVNQSRVAGLEEVTWMSLHIQQRRHKAMINDSLNYHTIITRKSNK